MYAYGRGMRQDDTEAVKWFRQAAAQGLTQAQYNLGIMYYSGRGVRQDRTLAQEWLVGLSKRIPKRLRQLSTPESRLLNDL